MFEYILNFYINRQFGISYVITEGLFLLGVVVIANRLKFTLAGIGKTLLHFLGLWLGYLVLASVVAYAGAHWLHYTNNINMSQFVWPIVLAVYLLCFSKYRLRTKIVGGVTYFVCFSLILSLTEAIGFILRMRYNINYMTLYSIILLVLALIVYLYRFNPDDCIFVPKFAIIFACIFAVISYCAMTLLRGLERESIVILLSSLLATDLMAYYMFYAISSKYKRDVADQIRHERKAGARDVLLISKTGYGNIHVVLHDIKNQFAMLNALLSAGKYQEAIDFLNAFELFASPVIESVDCGNAVVDSALSVCKAKAAENSITLNTRVAVPPVLAVSDIELVSVICNLTENAIEACVRENCTDTPVNVDIRYQRGYLLLHVDNPVSAQMSRQDRLLLRSRKGGVRHGWGTQIVRDIAEKYNGLVKYDVVDGKFVADVMLAITQ